MTATGLEPTTTTDWRFTLKRVRDMIRTYSYKDVLLGKKCLRHSMIRVQSKHHKIRTYGIAKISLSCFDDKIYIQNNGYDELTLGY